MASTTALLTALSGMTANARRLDVIGNNIANVNTTAYKANRILFSPTFSRTLSSGSGPSGVSGGTNPAQIGLGISIAGTQRNFSSGGISATGQATDLAVEGQGFFVVKKGDQAFYTRNGSFQLNATRELVTSNGDRVQGFAVDDNFNIVDGNLVGLTVPVGSLTIAGATQNVNFAGNLNAGGSAPTHASQIQFNQLFQDTLGTPLVPTDLLTALDDPNNPGTALFSGTLPYEFTLDKVNKGGKVLKPESLTITGATTVQDFLDFINQSLGIVPGLPNPDPTALSPLDFTGAQLDALGMLTIVGNGGEANKLTMAANSISINDGSVPPIALISPFTLTETATADGEGVRTTFTVFDSLGTALAVDLTMTLEAKTNGGTSWRYYVESDDNSIALTPNQRAILSGVIDFDNFGRLTTTSPVVIDVARDNTGAASPLSINIAFASAGNKVTALDNSGNAHDSTLAAVFQDGTPLGTLSTFSVGGDGVISGGFSNGLSRTIGRVAVATFSKPEGLFDVGNDLFSVGPNSGTPLITTPGQFGAGKLIGGALEQSNVDLGQEFIELVLTSTGYSASSRVISTTDQLLQQLIALGR